MNVCLKARDSQAIRETLIRVLGQSKLTQYLRDGAIDLRFRKMI
jgi:hypothetical protein